MTRGGQWPSQLTGLIPEAEDAAVTAAVGLALTSSSTRDSTLTTDCRDSVTKAEMTDEWKHTKTRDRCIDR